MFADLIPILFLLLLAFGVVWIVWRLVRRLSRSRAQKRQEPGFQTDPEPYESRPEPPLRAVASSPSTIPDAADVLALKAAIDNLARQVAALERRLASDAVAPQESQPSPATAMKRAPAPPEAPPVILDRRL
jgi:flagellar biosynthesis/type III secretory pathway M-ring protein FliF/YscJ